MTILERVANEENDESTDRNKLSDIAARLPESPSSARNARYELISNGAIAWNLKTDIVPGDNPSLNTTVSDSEPPSVPKALDAGPLLASRGL